MATDRLPDLVRYATLDAVGLSRHRLDTLVDAQEYERIAPGVFVRIGAVDDTTAAWMSISARRADATLCLLSALAMHELTDEIPTRSDVALPRGAHRLATRHAPIAWHFFDRATFDVGRSLLELGAGMTIGLYGPERTIIDVFRLRHAWGPDLAVEALKRWLRRPGASPGALLDMAREFPKARPALQAALQVLL